MAIVVKGQVTVSEDIADGSPVEKKTLGVYLNDSSANNDDRQAIVQHIIEDESNMVSDLLPEFHQKDSLDEMFELRIEFMKSLRKKYPIDNPPWPLDLSKKIEQQYCRDIALRGVEEMFEALQHLKNWKPHRTTEITEFDKAEFLEEIVDAFNYFFSLLILTGHTSSDLYNAYLKKDRVIHERLKGNY